MSVYFLRNTTTDEIVNRVEWDGVTEYTPEDGLELVLDTGSYFYTGSFPEITTTHYGGLFQGDFVGTSTGSFNGYSGSLDWLDAFATASRTGSFTGSFTGSLQGSSSYSETSSYFSSIKSGVINMGEWAVDMAFNYTASVNFSSSYSTGNYSIAITPAGDIRNFTITNKRLNGFNVDTNSGTPMTSDVYWIVIPYNNP